MNYEIIKWNLLTKNEQITSIQRPIIESQESQEEIISEIFKNVNRDGDIALRSYTKKFDGVELNDLVMSDNDIESAFQRTSINLIRSIENAIRNIERFHKQNIQ